MAVADAELEGVGRKTEGFEEADGGFDDFGIHLCFGFWGRLIARQPNHIHIPLEELAESATLRAFGSEVGAGGEPFAGFWELFGVSTVHAGQGGGELWAQGIGCGGGLLNLLDFFVGFA